MLSRLRYRRAGAGDREDSHCDSQHRILPDVVNFATGGSSNPGGDTMLSDLSGTGISRQYKFSTRHQFGHRSGRVAPLPTCAGPELSCTKSQWQACMSLTPTHSRCCLGPSFSFPRLPQSANIPEASIHQRDEPGEVRRVSGAGAQ